MHASLKADLTSIVQRPQRQDATVDQLVDLRVFANRLGMYDAADFLRVVIERQQAAGATPAPGIAVADLVDAGEPPAGRDALENTQVIQMAREAQVCFAQMLIKPQEPNEALTKAEMNNKRLIRSE